MSGKITAGQCAQVSAPELAREVLREADHYNRAAIELAKRVEAIDTAMVAYGGGFMDDRELEPQELVRILDRVENILNNTKDVTL